MTELTKRRNELEAAAEELALVTPYADEYPEQYQAIHDEWLRARERYEEALAQEAEVDAGPLWCEDDAIDEEDYEDAQSRAPTPTPTPTPPETHQVSGDGDVIDLGDDQGAEQDEDTAYGPDNPYRLEDLTQNTVPDWIDATLEQYHDFKRAVYRETVRRAARSRGFIRGIPADRIGTLRQRNFHVDLLDDGEALITAAEAALALAQAQGDASALRARTSITLASAYRDADEQFDLWNGRFSAVYVHRHREELQRLAGVPLSTAWVDLLARRIGAATATPGYSLHQRGISLDFNNPQPGIANEKTNAAMVRWRNTWFYAWLLAHAGEHGFEPYDGEAWHWNYTALMNE
jgi:LAS superfamily LD-carboxypeptidase LdcB